MGLAYNNILVALDGSKEAELAFKKAVSIAKDNNAKLLLAHVIDTRGFMGAEAYDPTVMERANKFANEMLENYQEIALKEGIPVVENNVSYGSPKIVISKEIPKNYNCDLIVCGATGLNAVERFFMGNVSEYVVRFAPCDVLIVR